jgi:hypothetical protein
VLKERSEEGRGERIKANVVELRESGQMCDRYMFCDIFATSL